MMWQLRHPLLAIPVKKAHSTPVVSANHTIKDLNSTQIESVARKSVRSSTFSDTYGSIFERRILLPSYLLANRWDASPLFV